VQLDARRGSEQYHSTKSLIAWSYALYPLRDERLLRAADFACSRSGSPRTLFGVLFFSLDFGMSDGLRWPSPLEPAIGGKIVTEMDRLPSRPVKDPPNLVGAASFSMDRLLSHIDPGTAEESEDFVRLIYDQRHIDLSSDRNGKIGR
jgi:hypothetical protein